MRLGFLAFLALSIGPEVVAREGVRKADAELLGSWKAVASVTDGAAMAAEEVAANPAVMEFTADKVVFRVGDRIFQEGIYRSDPAQHPKTLDTVYISKEGLALKSIGIYEVKGGELRICFVPERGKRPRSFDSPAGSRTTLITYERAR